MAVVHASVSVEVNFTAGPQTQLQLLAPTNQKVKITEVSLSGQGISNTELPLNVQLLRQTTAGTGTPSTEVKMDPDDGVTLQVVAVEDFTAEPTPGDILVRWFVHPQAGIVWVPPPGTEVILPGAGRVGLRILDSPSTALDINSYIKWEE